VRQSCFLIAAALGTALVARLPAADPNFVGAWIGVSAISADGRTITTPDTARISLYTPENGFSSGVMVGRHLTDIFSLQGSYLRNSNSLLLTSSTSSSDDFSLYEQRRKATMDIAIAEVLVYARKRGSSVRPYVTVGGGMVRVSSAPGSIVVQSSNSREPPGAFSTWSPAIQVGVGVDVPLGKGWAFRYAFNETISRGNPISDQLEPPGLRNLANFQNLWGFTKSF